MASWYSSPPLLHRTKRQIARSLPGHGRSSQKLQYTGFAVLAKQLQAVQCGCMGRRWRIGGRFIRKGEEKGCKSNCCGSSRYCTANLGSIQMLQVATHLRKYTLSGNLSPKWSLCRTPCKMFSRGVPGYAVVTPLPYNGSPYGPVGQCDPANSAVGYVNIVQRHLNLFSFGCKWRRVVVSYIWSLWKKDFQTFRLSSTLHLLRTI